MPPQKTVPRAAGNSLLIEYIEDLFYQNKIRCCVIRVPEFIEQGSPILVGTAEDEIGEIGVENFIDEWTIVRWLDGASTHDEIDVRCVGTVVQIHENFRRALACPYDRDPFCSLVPCNIPKVAVRMKYP